MCWFFGAWLMAGTCSRKVPLFLACFWLVGSMFPYSTCICLTVAVWPLILKTCVRATPYYTYLPPIPFKIAQYFFLPIYRSHCACALRDCRLIVWLIVHTITGVNFKILVPCLYTGPSPNVNSHSVIFHNMILLAVFKKLS